MIQINDEYQQQHQSDKNNETAINYRTSYPLYGGNIVESLSSIPATEGFIPTEFGSDKYKKKLIIRSIVRKKSEPTQAELLINILRDYSKYLSEQEIKALIEFAPEFENENKNGIKDCIISYRNAKSLNFRRKNNYDIIFKDQGALDEKIQEYKLSNSKLSVRKFFHQDYLSKAVKNKKRIDKHVKARLCIPLELNNIENKNKITSFKKQHLVTSLNAGTKKEFIQKFTEAFSKFNRKANEFKREFKIAFEEYKKHNPDSDDYLVITKILETKPKEIQDIKDLLKPILKDVESRAHFNFLNNDMIAELKKYHNIAESQLPEPVFSLGIMDSLKNNAICKQGASHIDVDQEYFKLLENTPRLLANMALANLDKSTYFHSCKGVPHTTISKEMQDYLFQYTLIHTKTNYELHIAFRNSVAQFRGTTENRLLTLQNDYYKFNNLASLAVSNLIKPLAAISTTPVGTVVWLYAPFAIAGLPPALAHVVTPPIITDITLAFLTGATSIPIGTLLAPANPYYVSIKLLQKRIKIEYDEIPVMEKSMEKSSYKKYTDNVIGKAIGASDTKNWAMRQVVSFGKKYKDSFIPVKIMLREGKEKTRSSAHYLKKSHCFTQLTPSQIKARELAINEAKTRLSGNPLSTAIVDTSPQS